VYLHPVVEAVLLGCIAFQVASGLCLLARQLPRAIDWFESLQAAAGLYFAVFFMSHLSAVLRARHLRGTDTNWQWLTADDLLTDPWSARLAPYYFLAVVALGVHGGAGIRRVMLAHGRPAQQADRIFYVCAAAATALSASIMTALIRG
jgi:succinate dehydrogenase/fumarate reductase cytochrome b subunit